VSDRGTVHSLPMLCFEAADGDPVLALALALDFIREQGREWRGESATVEAEAA
jgi:hypothetical protein